MSEWQPNSNRGGSGFIGPYTERQQATIDRETDMKNLRELLPEACRDCRQVSAFVLGSLARQVVNGEIGEVDEIRQTIQGSLLCPGPQSDPFTSDGDSYCQVADRPESVRKNIELANRFSE